MFPSPTGNREQQHARPRCKSIAKRVKTDPTKFDLKTFRSTYATEMLRRILRTTVQHWITKSLKTTMRYLAHTDVHDELDLVTIPVRREGRPRKVRRETRPFEGRTITCPRRRAGTRQRAKNPVPEHTTLRMPARWMRWPEWSAGCSRRHQPGGTATMQITIEVLEDIVVRLVEVEGLASSSARKPSTEVQWSRAPPRCALLLLLRRDGETQGRRLPGEPHESSTTRPRISEQDLPDLHDLRMRRSPPWRSASRWSLGHTSTINVTSDCQRDSSPAVGRSHKTLGTKIRLGLGNRAGSFRAAEPIFWVVE